MRRIVIFTELRAHDGVELPQIFGYGLHKWRLDFEYVFIELFWSNVNELSSSIQEEGHWVREINTHKALVSYPTASLWASERSVLPPRSSEISKHLWEGELFRYKWWQLFFISITNDRGILTTTWSWLWFNLDFLFYLGMVPLEDFRQLGIVLRVVDSTWDTLIIK